MAFRSLQPQSARGRQAQARRNDLAVLDAARDVFSALGADAPVSAVAAQAGVGVGTLYRRYGSKTELLQRLCLVAMEQALAAAEAALRSPDSWAGLAGYIRACVDMRSGALAALAGRVAVTDEMRLAADRGIAAVTELVSRAQRAGSLRGDVTPLDIALLIEAFSRRPPGLGSPAEERGARDRLLAITLDGLRSGQPAPLPGPPPSRDAYVARWNDGTMEPWHAGPPAGTDSAERLLPGPLP